MPKPYLWKETPPSACRPAVTTAELEQLPQTQNSGTSCCTGAAPLDTEQVAPLDSEKLFQYEGVAPQETEQLRPLLHRPAPLEIEL
jgi:hypothetical protein